LNVVSWLRTHPLPRVVLTSSKFDCLIREPQRRPKVTELKLAHAFDMKGAILSLSFTLLDYV